MPRRINRSKSIEAYPELGATPSPKLARAKAKGASASALDAAESLAEPGVARRRKTSRRVIAPSLSLPASRLAAPNPASKATQWLQVFGARHNNLKSIDVGIPLGRFVCVTGVSGSGKSSLINDVVRETLMRDLSGAAAHPGAHDRITGLESLDKVIDIDQSPIGRTPRSNPATYIKLFDWIRDLYAKLPESRARGYSASRFSFNVASGKRGGGRCEACEGNGSTRIDMDFLADVWVACPVCEGHRFSRETRQISFKGKSIADVLNMEVEQALTHFEHVPRIAQMLLRLQEVGLDYLTLGQPSTTLSGGEAQRIKLARELVRSATGRTLYILDEPTTGLHVADIERLLRVLHQLVDAGNSVVVIEHNLDVVKTADWVIDLGPEGGARGGFVVAEGTPEDIAGCVASLTGQALALVLTPHLAAKVHEASLEGGCQEWTTAPEDAEIQVLGARENNLKNLNVQIPRNQITVCCGPSGSGKTSFALDTVYTEGQRRYVESLSSYARQFVSRLQPPKVDQIRGLSPAICIEQRNASASPRSTVGTVTEIYDYVRVLWSRIGRPHCPECDALVEVFTADEIVDRIFTIAEGGTVIVCAPIVPEAGESTQKLLLRHMRSGMARVRIDGQMCDIRENLADVPLRPAQIEWVIDRITVDQQRRVRITDGVEQALAIGGGKIVASVLPAKHEAPKQSSATSDQSGQNDSWTELRFSRLRVCQSCAVSVPELNPHNFSFNSRLGWCESCEGLGVQKGAAEESVVVASNRSIVTGALLGWSYVSPSSALYDLLSAVADQLGFRLDQPWKDLTRSQRQGVLHGCPGEWISPRHARFSFRAPGLVGLRVQWRGFLPAIQRLVSTNPLLQARWAEFTEDAPCIVCSGARIRRDAAAVRVGGLQIQEVCEKPLGEALAWFRGLSLPAHQRTMAGGLLQEIEARIGFLVEVGLDYVSLHRTAATLSGGESQRIRLASQIGTGLTGVLYVLDEPTIGLHPRDNRRLWGALARLRDLGNTLLLVEHDRDIIESADHVLDFGPGAGEHGGELTASGSPSEIRAHDRSLTGAYLSGKKGIAVPTIRRHIPRNSHENKEAIVTKLKRRIAGAAAELRAATEELPGWIWVRNARENNLDGIDVAFPLGRFTCVTGVSGSGKSTLVGGILHPALAAQIHRARNSVGKHDRLEGVKQLDKVVSVDQSPLGNSPTSNPATYTGAFDWIRELFAKIPLSRIRGYSSNRFSFNRIGGRCEVCEGMGQRCIEMHFLPDVWVECESCKGDRYVPETLEIKFKGHSIADVLRMPVTAALELFSASPKMSAILQTLDDVGLGYVQLGQSAPTLSGGEAQRVKLSAELARPSTGRTMYILDEPTTGLHFDDIGKLLRVLHRLVDQGNTCVCVEHNLDVIKTADWVIDLGPEAGDDGGRIVVQGTPEDVIACPESHTGKALREFFHRNTLVVPAEPKPAQTKSADSAKVARRRKSSASSVAVGVERSSNTSDGGFPPEPHSLVLEFPEGPEAGDLATAPWNVDGRRWHLFGAKEGDGGRPGWSADALRWMVEAMESCGGFAPTDWNHQSRIEMGLGGSRPWFCHILTRDAEFFQVGIRVHAGEFFESIVADRLGVASLPASKARASSGAWNRVCIRPASDGWDEVRLYLRDMQDIRPGPMTSFLVECRDSFFRRMDEFENIPGEAEPWKSQGRDWHFSQRSIHRQKVAWKPELLAGLLGRFAALQTDAVLDWAHKTAVKVSIPGEPHYAAKIVTNIGRGLRVEIRAPQGCFSPGAEEILGDELQVVVKPNESRIVFWIDALSKLDGARLRRIWEKRRKAFLQSKERRSA